MSDTIQNTIQQEVLWCADCGQSTANRRLPCGWWVCEDCWGRYAPDCRECDGCAPWCALSLDNGGREHFVAAPAAKAVQAQRAVLAGAIPEPVCPRCESGEVSFHGDQLIAVTEDWTKSRHTHHDVGMPPGEWVGPVQGECDACGHEWAVLPSQPMCLPMHLPETPEAKQAYLVVYLDGGVVAGHEVAADVEQARRKCLAHANQDQPPTDLARSVTGDDLVHGPDGAFSVGDGLDLDAWAFPIPARVVADGRPANEDQIRLYCKFSTPGMGLCGWSGPASEAGWDSHYGEWICPDCGSADGIQVVEAEPEVKVPPEPPPDDWLEAAYESRTELADM